jgi:hypothetical protein
LRKLTDETRHFFPQGMMFAMHFPPAPHISGAQQSALVRQPPHVPPMQAWLPQSLQLLQPGAAASGCVDGGGVQTSPAPTTARS